MNSNLLKIFSVLFLVFFILMLFLNSPSKCEEKQVMEMSMVVDEQSRSVVGINTDTDHLNFGKVSSGSNVRRSIVVGHPGAMLKILLNGEIAKWVSVNENNIRMVNNKTITFQATVPSYAQEGNYTGEAIFCFN